MLTTKFGLVFAFGVCWIILKPAASNAIAEAPAAPTDTVDKVLCGEVTGLKQSCWLIYGDRQAVACSDTGRCREITRPNGDVDNICESTTDYESAYELVIESDYQTRRFTKFQPTNDPDRNKKIETTEQLCYTLFNCNSKCQRIDGKDACIKLDQNAPAAPKITTVKENGPCPASDTEDGEDDNDLPGPPIGGEAIGINPIVIGF